MKNERLAADIQTFTQSLADCRLSPDGDPGKAVFSFHEHKKDGAVDALERIRRTGIGRAEALRRIWAAWRQPVRVK